jgi:hypothetical protein
MERDCDTCKNNMAILDPELCGECIDSHGASNWTPKDDPVNHPSHYTDGKIEVIDLIEDKKLGFHLGNAIKYIARAGKKDPTKTKQDLEKAVWYIERYIAGMGDV